MKIPKQEIEQRMARFNETCRKSGAKLTHQRMEIFREVAQTGDHPDAEKVFRVCASGCPPYHWIRSTERSGG